MTEAEDRELFQAFLVWRETHKPIGEAHPPAAPVIEASAEPAAKPAADIPPESPPIKLLITAKPEEREGWTNDVRDPTSRRRVGVLAYDDGALDMIEAKEVFQQIEQDDRFAFMDEAWRALKVGGQLIIIVPGRGSNRSYMDPFNQWPPVVEDFFYFVSREWREANGYGHYPVTANFHWGYGFVVDDEYSMRNEETQRHAIKFYRNAAHSLIVTLTKLE